MGYWTKNKPQPTPEPAPESDAGLTIVGLSNEKPAGCACKKDEIDMNADNQSMARHFAQLLQGLIATLQSGNMSRGAYCRSKLEAKLDPNGCNTGLMICKREQTVNNLVVAAGASQDVFIKPPGEAEAQQLIAAAPSATWLLNSIKIGSKTVFEGPVDLATFSARFRDDQSVSWPLFDASTNVIFNVTNDTLAGLSTAGILTLAYKSQE